MVLPQESQMNPRDQKEGEAGNELGHVPSESASVLEMVEVTPGLGQLDDLEDLELPEPALPKPVEVPMPRQQRASAFQPLPVTRRPSTSLFASPRLTPATPRMTRFDLTPSSPPLHAAALPYPHLLRPILQPTPVSPYPLAEMDIGEQLLLGTPVFAARDDDSPHPQRAGEEESRTPHPLYTPAVLRRERSRRRAHSRASRSSGGRTTRSVRSANHFVKSAWKMLRKKTRLGGNSSKHNVSMSNTGTQSVTSISSSSSSTSSSSNSTWNGWRFWRNSSAGSTSDGESLESEEEWEPPTPHFTLLTPCLDTTSPNYPVHLQPSHPRHAQHRQYHSHLDHAHHPHHSSPNSAQFELLTSSTIAPTLERLQSFWTEKRQAETTTAPGSAPITRLTSRPVSLKDEPATRSARLLKGEEKAAKKEEQRGTGTRKGEGKKENPPAWWLDVMCPTVADMRELRKVSLAISPPTSTAVLIVEWGIAATPAPADHGGCLAARDAGKD